MADTSRGDYVASRLTIVIHTGDGAAAVEQLEIVTSGKVGPAKFVWVHAE
jgi:predicted metal-dependent phosphotriesterase family hydrolase